MNRLVLHLTAALSCCAVATLCAPSRAADTPSASDAERARIEYIQRALKGEPSPVPGKRIMSAGTGFYVTPQRILTNRHVVDGCAGVTLRGTWDEIVQQMDAHHGKSVLRVILKYAHGGQSVIREAKRISTPGLRKYVGVQEIPRVRNGLGMAILSTSKGLMSDRDARAANTGGELLALVW